MRRVVIIGAGFGGTLAWLLWLFVHIYYLIGFRNRFFVLCSWAWSHLTYRRGARLILPSAWRAHEEEGDADEPQSA